MVNELNWVSRHDRSTWGHTLTLSDSVLPQHHKNAACFGKKQPERAHFSGAYATGITNTHSQGRPVINCAPAWWQKDPILVKKGCSTHLYFAVYKLRNTRASLCFPVWWKWIMYGRRWKWAASNEVCWKIQLLIHSHASIVCQGVSILPFSHAICLNCMHVMRPFPLYPRSKLCHILQWGKIDISKESIL